jgi:5-methyltetrahydropteroyltriglutamate--homocysteine methyltransferase
MKARASLRDGSLSAAAYKQIEDRAVDEAIALQEGVGLDVLTDGEMRRASYFEEIFELDGVARATDSGAKVRFSGGAEFAVPAVATEKVSRKSAKSVEEFSYARAKARTPVKVTLPSPLHFRIIWSPEASKDAYPDVFSILEDGAQIIHDEAKALAALGCEYIQIDAPELVQALVDERVQEKWDEVGLPASRLWTEGIELINSIADVPGVTFGLHMCRGNFQSQWLAEGGYENVAKVAFPRTDNYDGYLLEFDDPRSGGFEPLANLPDDKFAVLGLVSTKTDTVEDEAAVAKRLEEATRFVDKEQLAISTQCGFASDEVGNSVSASSQEAKLRLVADLAHETWG